MSVLYGRSFVWPSLSRYGSYTGVQEEKHCTVDTLIDGSKRKTHDEGFCIITASVAQVLRPCVMSSATQKGQITPWMQIQSFFVPLTVFCMCACTELIHDRLWGGKVSAVSAGMPNSLLFKDACRAGS